MVQESKKDFKPVKKVAGEKEEMVIVTGGKSAPGWKPSPPVEK